MLTANLGSGERICREEAVQLRELLIQNGTRAARRTRRCLRPSGIRALLDEVRQLYGGKVVIGHDLDVF